MVSKQIQPCWYLQQLVDAEVRRLAPDAAVTPVVMYDDEKIQRHEDCPGVGRVRWYVRYVLPAADSSARALKDLPRAGVVAMPVDSHPWRCCSGSRQPCDLSSSTSAETIACAVGT